MLGRDVDTQHLGVTRDAGARRTRARQGAGELVGDVDATVANGHCLEGAGVADVGSQGRHHTILDVVHVVGDPLRVLCRGDDVDGLDAEGEAGELELLGGLGEVADEVHGFSIVTADREVISEVDPAVAVELHGTHDDAAQGDVDHSTVGEVVGRVDAFLLQAAEHAIAIAVDVAHHGHVLDGDVVAGDALEHPGAEVDVILAGDDLVVLGSRPGRGELHLQGRLGLVGVAGIAELGELVAEVAEAVELARQARGVILDFLIEVVGDVRATADEGEGEGEREQGGTHVGLQGGEGTGWA